MSTIVRWLMHVALNLFKITKVNVEYTAKINFVTCALSREKMVMKVGALFVFPQFLFHEVRIIPIEEKYQF